MDGKHHPGFWPRGLYTTEYFAVAVLLLTLAGTNVAASGFFTQLEKASDTLLQDPRFAFAIYAPPATQRQLRCEAAVESLRSLGHWGGRIYLLARDQQARCYEHERWTQCGLDADIVSLSVPTPVPEAVQSRLVKSRMWDLVQPDPSVQALIFIDGCGALFTSSVAPLLQSAAQMLGLTSTPGISSVIRLAVPQNATVPATQVSYDKLWMVRRIGSQQILHAYRQQTLKQGASASEQSILQGTAQAVDPSCHDTADECLQQMVPAVARYDFIRPLSCEGGEEGCRFLEEKPAVVTLLDRTCDSLDHRLVNRFVATSLDLCSLQGVDQALCVDPLMSVFLNPWVPYPRCAKVELGLSRIACQWTCVETSFFRTGTYRTSISAAAVAPDKRRHRALMQRLPVL